MDPTMALLQVEGLHIDIQAGALTRQVVRGVSFSVARGKTLCIVGESGCGKSLTALSLLGLLPGAAQRRVGVLRLAGQDLGELDEKAFSSIRGARMAMVFQDPMTSLNPVFTVGTQLIDVLRRHRKVSRSQARERARHLLQRVGIADPEARMRQYPFELSGGLRQRVMIAMALMCGPELLIADEPTTALDVTVQSDMLDLLKGLQQEFGLGMVFITHDLGLVARIADDLAVMYAGEIVESGPAEAVLRDPAHPYTQRLLDCIPRPGSTQPGSVLPSIAGTVPSLDSPITGCAFADRCSAADALCRQPFAPAAVGPHRYRCLKPRVLQAGPPRQEAA